MKPGSLLPLAIAPLLTFGCGDTLGPVPDTPELIVASSRYTAGDTATISLVNLSARNVDYNGCFMIIERRIDDGWLDIHWWPANTVCPAIAYVLAPGETTTIRIPLRVDLPSDSYRARLDVGFRGEQISLTTRTFEIEDVIHRHE